MFAITLHDIKGFLSLVIVVLSALRSAALWRARNSNSQRAARAVSRYSWCTPTLNKPSYSNPRCTASSAVLAFAVSSSTYFYFRQSKKMDNSGKEKEAIQLMADADKKVKSSGSFLGGMFGG